MHVPSLSARRAAHGERLRRVQACAAGCHTGRHMAKLLSEPVTVCLAHAFGPRRQGSASRVLGCLSRRLRGGQEALAGCLQDLAVRSLLPALEGRVRALNHQARPRRSPEPPAALP